MRRGETIHGGDGLLHVLWGVRGVGASYPVTYCDRTIREVIASTPDAAPTCVRCIAMRQSDLLVLTRFSLSD